MTKSEFDQPHEADGLSAPICSRVLSVLHAEVLGIYLFGSLATNDFDEGVSDIDVLVVTARDLNESELSQLGVMHVDLVARPQWKDRIEVIYLSAAALQSFRASVRHCR